MRLMHHKHPMILLGEEAQVEAQFDLFGDSANLDIRWVHGLCGTYHMLRNPFGLTEWNSKMTCVIWCPASINLETVSFGVT